MWRGADALPVSCQWFESSEQQHGKTTRGSCPTTLKSHHSLGATHAACQTILCCPRLMLWLARCFWIRLFSSACSYHPSVQGAGVNKKQPEPKTLSGSEAETVYRTVCSTDWPRENLCTDNVNLTFDKLKKKKKTQPNSLFTAKKSNTESFSIGRTRFIYTYKGESRCSPQLRFFIVYHFCF